MENERKNETVGKPDDGFLVEACDRIDNAVWDAIVAVFTGNGNETKSVEDALKSLMLHDEEELSPACIYEEASDTIKLTVNRLGGLEFDDDGEAEWDMEVIGEVEDVLEGVLKSHGITSCHPWEEDDNICYSCADHCEGCPRSKQQAHDEERRLSVDELAKITDARDVLCGFCECDPEECERCKVTQLVNDAYNECPEMGGENDW